MGQLSKDLSELFWQYIGLLFWPLVFLAFGLFLSLLPEALLPFGVLFGCFAAGWLMLNDAGQQPS